MGFNSGFKGLKSVGVLSLRNNDFSEDITVLLFRYTNQRRYPYNQCYVIVRSGEIWSCTTGKYKVGLNKNY